MLNVLGPKVAQIGVLHEREYERSLQRFSARRPRKSDGNAPNNKQCDAGECRVAVGGVCAVAGVVSPLRGGREHERPVRRCVERVFPAPVWGVAWRQGTHKGAQGGTALQ